MAQPAAAQRTFLATTPGLVLGCTFACLLWGSAFPCIKIGYGLFGIASTDVASIIAFAGALSDLRRPRRRRHEHRAPPPLRARSP